MIIYYLLKYSWKIDKVNLFIRERKFNELSMVILSITFCQKGSVVHWMVFKGVFGLENVMGLRKKVCKRFAHVCSGYSKCMQ